MTLCCLRPVPSVTLCSCMTPPAPRIISQVERRAGLDLDIRVSLELIAAVPIYAVGYTGVLERLPGLEFDARVSLGFLSHGVEPCSKDRRSPKANTW